MAKDHTNFKPFHVWENLLSHFLIKWLGGSILKDFAGGLTTNHDLALLPVSLFAWNPTYNYHRFDKHIYLTAKYKYTLEIFPSSFVIISWRVSFHKFTK